MVWLIVMAVAVVAIFAVPLRFRAELHGGDRLEWRAEVVWLGGLVCVTRSSGGTRFCVAGVRKDFARGGEAAADNEHKRPKGSIAARWRELAAVERRAAVRLVRDIWTAADFAARGSFRYGCDDPATTAWLHAAYCLVQATGRLAELTAEADFTWVGWSGRVEASCSLRPIMLAVPVLRFLLLYAGGRIKKHMTGGKNRWQMQT